MWFKQVQLFRLLKPINSSPNEFAKKLEPLIFNDCLPTMPSSYGWVSPIEEDDAPLALAVNGCIMFCLQIEEKILPASVVAQNIKEKIKSIESAEARKVRAKEKLSLKDEMVHTLLPRAFSKFSRINAYVDTRNNWLIVNNTSPVKVELFISTFKKSFGECVEVFDVSKPTALMTHWLKSNEHPSVFSIEKACVLQDPNKENRVIRCQEQDLFAGSIQALVKDGCEVKQMALCWYDRLVFTLADDFTLRSIRLADEDLVDMKDDIETKLQKFTADFLMMSEMLTGLIKDLLEYFVKNKEDASKLGMVA